ncbi:hypothetical protein J1605_013225 [Eschrichtius robustus]|uniref:Beta/gamma crystallin 'Greek key' domain-containing protein n=1 Tax=Eschrichtius robustus TaxID=9764 RepID=A0AB34GFW0_ESCRO|nr:hypothetical protein J1605_013225 [Eschrichtius robustus]
MQGNNTACLNWSVLQLAEITHVKALSRGGMSSAPAQGPAPASLTLWDEEDFQGRRCRLLSDCANIGERVGLRRVRSVKVENGA